jgi:outer membrane protein OmpA-like peptidoglycan-associated protein
MKKYLLLTGLFFGLIGSPILLEAQINLGSKLKDQTNRRSNNEVDKGINKSFDNVENGVKGLFKKKKNNVDQANSKAKVDSTKTQSQANGKGVKSGADTTPSLASYSKFDFTPGEKVIFYDDFSQDNVGDFPALWFSNGSGEVVSLNNFPGKWMQITAAGCYYPERDLQTSENFTVEFDLIPGTEYFQVGFYLVSGNIKNPDEGGAIPGKAGLKTTIANSGVSLSGYSDGQYQLNGSTDLELSGTQKLHISYWVQKQRLRIYVNEKKVSDSPRIMPAGYKYNVLRFEMGEETKPYISNFRVAAGLPDTRNKLITEGKLVTYGIYFDVNKDVVKPESYGTLKDIATVLNEVPDVKVKIVGHTDSDGADAANLDLSKRRSAAVKAELAKSFGVNANRLVTDGMGKTQPVAPNDTPVNKALNRRVEFIKM